MKALISVSDKTGIVEFAKGLTELGVDILSTGGTAKALRDGGVEVMDVSDYTGFPEMMDGRVKTLHPKIHGGLLALRDNSNHMEAAKTNGVDMIDLVVVNLYPFQKTIAKENVELGDAVENIDIGGPTILRSAAKNFRFVTVVVDPDDYEGVLKELKENKKISKKTNERLAVKVFRHTADYDAAIDKYLSSELADEKILRLKYTGGVKLRYGENWHQTATAYFDKSIDESSVCNAKQLHGKEMSFNNYVDGNASFEAVKEVSDKTAVTVIKHTNPCGFATGSTLGEAIAHAWQGDTTSAFGSIISCTRKVDLATAEFLKGKFVEAIIAPGFDEDALEFLKKKSKDLRLLEVPALESGDKEKFGYKHVTGGMLEQSRDLESVEKWDCATSAKFPKDKKGLAEFAWIASKWTKSNAIVIAYEYKQGQYMVLGMGAGQPNRIDSLRKLSLTKARENLEQMGLTEKELEKCVLASDAFFPFDDTVREAGKASIRLIVQPGGSKRDEEVIKACDELGISMIFTGMRHFMH